MDDKTLAQKIRQFVRDLLGSRLVEHLEAQLFLQQSLYESRLNERDQEIARLRQEALRLTAKFEEYELDPSYFWWLAQRGKASPPASPDLHSLSEVPTPKTWREIQVEHYAREEAELQESNHGVQDSGRGEIVRE